VRGSGPVEWRIPAPTTKWAADRSRPALSSLQARTV